MLEEAGLAKHLGAFEAQEITLSLLPHLTEEDLKGLGLGKVGARVRLRAICKHLASLPEVSED